MSDLLPFISAHWMLCGAFLIVLFAVILLELQTKQLHQGEQVSPTAAMQLHNRNQAQLIDLRDPAAFNNGHIKHASNIPASEVEQQHAAIKQLPNTPIILINEQGTIPKQVALTFQQLGHTEIKVLQGGMQAWKEEHLPLSSSNAKHPKKATKDSQQAAANDATNADKHTKHSKTELADQSSEHKDESKSESDNKNENENENGNENGNKK